LAEAARDCLAADDDELAEISAILSSANRVIDEMIMSFGAIMQAAHAMDTEIRMQMASQFAEILQAHGIEAHAVKVYRDGTVTTADGTPVDVAGPAGPPDPDPSTLN
jgi:hypothetical protein